jgi:hypothetical protein
MSGIVKHTGLTASPCDDCESTLSSAKVLTTRIGQARCLGCVPTPMRISSEGGK